MWQLKKSENAFQVTREGSFEYCRFKHGVLYDNIPKEERDRFEEVASAFEGAAPKKIKGVKKDEI